MTTNTTDTALTTSQHGTASHEVYTAGFYTGAGEWDFTVRQILGKAPPQRLRHRGGAGHRGVCPDRRPRRMV